MTGLRFLLRVTLRRLDLANEVYHIREPQKIPLVMSPDETRRLLRYELVEGSGGAGRFRGGMGLRRMYRAEAECHLRLDGSRLLTPPWGLNGGHPGGRGAFHFGDGVEAFVRGSGRLHPGETVEIITPGAGGYGPPLE